jgi:Ni,Fe-hydrogenase III large subunit
MIPRGNNCEYCYENFKTYGEGRVIAKKNFTQKSRQFVRKISSQGSLLEYVIITSSVRNTRLFRYCLRVFEDFVIVQVSAGICFGCQRRERPEVTSPFDSVTPLLYKWSVDISYAIFSSRLKISL